MAGLWQRIQNVWSNELWTGDEARQWTDAAVTDARTDLAQGLVQIVNDPDVRAALRETAIQLGAQEIPLLAAAEEMGAGQVEPESLGVSDWLNGFASQIQYEIGRSEAGYHFRTETEFNGELLGLAEDETNVRSEWSLAYETPEAAEAAAQSFMGEWSKGDAAEQERYEREEQREDTGLSTGEENGISIVDDSGWIGGFGSEIRTYIGKSKNGWHHGTETEASDDISWSRAYPTREEAENGEAAAFNRWDARVGASEQAYEDMRIAEFAERSHPEDRKVELEEERSAPGVGVEV